MFATVTLLTLVNSVSGTPYISGDRFNTGNIERALLARGFQYGSQPGALNVGWNGGHTAATLPDGTPVSSGEGGGVRIGGGGAFQGQFSHHMFLPTALEEAPPAPDAVPAPGDPFLPPPPDMLPAPPAPDAPVVMMAQEAPMPAPEMAPPAPEPEMAPPPPPADPFAPPAPTDIPPPA
jgi:hypothetical protein